MLKRTGELKEQSSHSLLTPHHNIDLMKRPGQLSCRMLHILNFSCYFIMVSFNILLCSLYFF